MACHGCVCRGRYRGSRIVEILECHAFYPYSRKQSLEQSLHAHILLSILVPENQEHWKGQMKETGCKSNIRCSVTELLQIVTRNHSWLFCQAGHLWRGHMEPLHLTTVCHRGKVSNLSPGCFSSHLSQIKIQTVDDENVLKLDRGDGCAIM